VKQDNGEMTPIVLEEVKCISNLWINLFSICKEMKGDSKIENIDEVITLSKKNVTPTIYTLIKTNDGCVPLIELIPIFNNIGA
jgi:hypothetical protein